MGSCCLLFIPLGSCVLRQKLRVRPKEVGSSAVKTGGPISCDRLLLYELVRWESAELDFEVLPAWTAYRALGETFVALGKYLSS
jgi:hypothetical protein